MIGKIFTRNSDSKQKQKNIVKTIIQNLHISEKKKSLYLESLDFLDENGLKTLYKSLEVFCNDIEKKNIEDISKDNFTKIAGMRKKEVREKQEEINHFWFLLNNL